MLTIRAYLGYQINFNRFIRLGKPNVLLPEARLSEIARIGNNGITHCRNYFCDIAAGQFFSITLRGDFTREPAKSSLSPSREDSAKR